MATMKRICPFDIGDVYITTSDADPAAKWAGTAWERIRGRFLFAEDDSHGAGTVGGAAAHKHTTGGCTLTVDQIPGHTHSVGAHSHGLNSHTHTYAKPNTPTGGTAVTLAQMASHNHNSKSLTGAAKWMIWSDDAKDSGIIKFTNKSWNMAYPGAASNGLWGAALATITATHTHDSQGSGNTHTHTIGTTSTNSGGPSTANTANSTAFDSGSRGGVQRIPTATRETRRACRRIWRSTCGAARRSRVQRKDGVAMGSVIRLFGVRGRTAAFAGGIGFGKAA